MDWWMEPIEYFFVFYGNVAEVENVPYLHYDGPRQPMTSYQQLLLADNDGQSTV